VRYSNNNVQQRFGNNNQRAGANQRMDFRGRNGQPVLNPGNPGNGNRAGQRPTQQPAANRDNRQNAGNRQNANNRQNTNKRQNANNRQNANRAATNRPTQTSRNNNAARNNARTNTSVNRSNAMNVQRGNVARAQSTRGQASLGSARASVGMGGGPRGGGGGVRGGGGGRRSDIALKHDVVLLGQLANGLGFYRFSYNGSDTRYVGVIAQEVQAVMPDAVVRGRDGYLRVFYDKLGVRFETYQAWVAEGGHVPALQVH
jgi:hypothetical protein